MELFGIHFTWEAAAFIVCFFMGRFYEHGRREIRKRELALHDARRKLLKRLNKPAKAPALPKGSQSAHALVKQVNAAKGCAENPSPPRIESRPDLQAMTEYNAEIGRKGTMESPWLASSGCELTDEIWIACDRNDVDVCEFETPLEQAYADEHGFEDVRALRMFLHEEIQ